MSKFAGQEFMKKTSYQYVEPADQARNLPQPPLQMEYDVNATMLELPMPEEIPPIQVDFLALVELRTSVRTYQQQPLSLLELSYLLWCTQGVKEITGGRATKRTVPSAGARHAFETYLLINNVEGVRPGLYRFLALEHKLLEVDITDSIAERITAACLNQQFIKHSAVTFIWTADAYRMNWRYGERGYRYLHLDAGHVCQNLYLASQVIGCGACAVAAFDDDALHAALDLNGQEHFAVYAGTVGKR